MSKPEDNRPPRGDWLVDIGFQPVTDDIGSMVFIRRGPRGQTEQLFTPTYLSNSRAMLVQAIVRRAESEIREFAPSCNIAAALAQLADLLGPKSKPSAEA